MISIKRQTHLQVGARKREFGLKAGFYEKCIDLHAVRPSLMSLKTTNLLLIFSVGIAAKNMSLNLKMVV